MPYKSIGENEKWITVKNKHGKVEYEGIDHRFYGKDYPRCALGISYETWLKALVAIIGAIIFWNTYVVKNDAHLATIDGTLVELTGLSKEFRDYMQASDSFHTQATGVEFRGGRPTDPAAVIQRTKKINRLIEDQ